MGYKIDNQILRALASHETEKVSAGLTDVERLMMTSGASLNWIADAITDAGWSWEQRTFNIDELTLTGTNPILNAVVIDRAERSPSKLRYILQQEPHTRALFSAAVWRATPIIVCRDGEKLKVLDGMHRTLAAIRDGRTSIESIVGTPPITLRPHCEPHVVYDLIRPWEQKRTTDRAGLVAALRYLRQVYGNVDELLQNRFGPAWIRDQEIQKMIQEALQD